MLHYISIINLSTPNTYICYSPHGTLGHEQAWMQYSMWRLKTQCGNITPPGISWFRFLPGNYLSLFGDTPLALLYAVTDGQEDGATLVGSMYQSVGLYCASPTLVTL